MFLLYISAVVFLTIRALVLLAVAIASSLFYGS